MGTLSIFPKSTASSLRTAKFPQEPHTATRPVVRVYLFCCNRPPRGRHSEFQPDTSPVPNHGVHLCRCPHRSACAGRAPPRLPLNPRAHPRRCRRAGQPRGDPRHGRLPLGFRVRQGHRAQAERGSLRLLRELPTASTRRRTPDARNPRPSSPPREPSDDVWWTVVFMIGVEISPTLTRALPPS